MQNTNKSALKDFLPSHINVKNFDSRDWAKLSKQLSILFSKHFSNLIECSCLTQAEIAKKLGYESHVTISLIKNGKAKLPIEKAGLYAEILGVDKKALAIDVLIAYKPQLYFALQDAFEF